MLNSYGKINHLRACVKKCSGPIPEARPSGQAGGSRGVGNKVVVVPETLPAPEKREVGFVLVMGGRADLIESGGLLLSTPAKK